MAGPSSRPGAPADAAPPAPEDRESGRPGPIALPPGHRPHDPRWAWGVSAGVVVLALVLYFVARPLGQAAPNEARAPSWGALTLEQVSVQAARSDGEKRPSGATWLAAQRSAAIVALGLPAAAAGGSPNEADFVVVMQGRFTQGPGAGALPGSAPQGGYLVAFVRGFDGRLHGTLITAADPAQSLARIGLSHPLRLFALPF